MHNDLDVLAPAGASVKYRGEQLEILPLTVGQLPRMVRVARPLIDAVLEMDSLPGDDDNGELLTLVLDLVDKHGEAAFEAAAVATGKPREWIEGGDLADFVSLAKTVFEVNRDFFGLKLAPLLAGRAANGARPANGGGLTPSSSSSNTGTH